MKAKLAGHFAASKFTAIEIHTPGAAEGKGGSASVRVQPLTRTRATAGRKQEEITNYIANLGWSGNERQNKKHSLFIKCTAPTGWRAVLKEGVCELPVKVVRHGPRDSLPGQDEDDQHGAVTGVTRPLAHQAQQLLLLAAAPDHLSDGFCVHLHRITSRSSQTNDRRTTALNHTQQTQAFLSKQYHRI